MQINHSMLSMFRMVCDAPQGGGIAVERMPDFIDHDVVSNSLPHTHVFYEILWFREAGGIHTVDFQDYPVLQNSVFFLTPGQVHHFDGVTRHHGYSIKVCSDFCGQQQEENDPLHHELYYAHSVPYAQLDDEASETVESLIQRIEEEQNQTEGLHHREMLSLLVRVLMILLLRHTHRTNALLTDRLTPQQHLYIRFRNLLEQEFMHLHLVAEYAERLGVSTKTLTTAVRLCTGQTPLQVIDNRLILESKRLLRFSDLMVKEVAYHLGFDTPSNFVKFFRRHTSTLPSEYQG